MIHALITGASGFIGKPLADKILHQGWWGRLVVRCPRQLPAGAELVKIATIDGETNWVDALCSVDVVIHLAARVHIVNNDTSNPLAEFRRVNVQGTINLARQAASAGINRFVFVSTIKVNGEDTQPNLPYTAEDIPAPRDPYGISKYEAEEELRNLAKETGMDVVIIRPPLVYGPGVKANFLSMMKWLYKGIPLPLGAIHNKRSLVALDNLVDLIVTCIDHPAAANQTFLVSDGEDLSTTELLYRMGAALGKPARLFPVPSGLLKTAATIIGKREIAQRLLDSLQVDISKTQEVLGWTPPISVDEGLKRTAHWYLQNQNSA